MPQRLQGLFEGLFAVPFIETGYCLNGFGGLGPRSRTGGLSNDKRCFCIRWRL